MYTIRYRSYIIHYTFYILCISRIIPYFDSLIDYITNHYEINGTYSGDIFFVLPE